LHNIAAKYNPKPDLTHALSITLTLNPDPNFNPNPIAILHLYSAFRILPYLSVYVTLRLWS